MYCCRIGVLVVPSRWQSRAVLPRVVVPEKPEGCGARFRRRIDVARS